MFDQHLARRGSSPATSSVRGRTGVLAASALLVVAASTAALAGPTQDWVRTETRDDCTNYNSLRNPYFGDTHVHTAYSADAVLARTRNTPYDAYNFAKGGTVGLPPYIGSVYPPYSPSDTPSRTATIDRPLDFTAVTDHSEGFGDARVCLDPAYAGAGYDSALCQSIRQTFLNPYHPSNPLPTAFQQFFLNLTLPFPTRDSNICGPGPAYTNCLYEAGLVWNDIQAAAEANYDRTSACSFTSFVAYEWSGQTYANNLHRNIIYRNAEVPSAPVTYFEQWRDTDMRTAVHDGCIGHGNCDVLAIPHNSNFASDAMFSDREIPPTANGTGAKLTNAELAERAAMEPLIELTQAKGDSECRDGVLGTSDELCSFEKSSHSNITGPSNWNQNFSPLGYVRGGLKRGLEIERTSGINPFTYGFIGSTDTHNGVPGAVNEKDYGKIGQLGVADSSPAFALANATNPTKIELNPGGLAVVWAEENSRDAIFAAMRRRETYSTSGTRPIVRVFAGRYPVDSMCSNPNRISEGYDKGVPMGGDIGPVRGKFSPRIFIEASKDPVVGTPLQHVQVIKGWLDAKTHQSFEKVYEAAGNAANGADVDTATCTRTPGTPASADSLCTVWEDPDFKPTQNAFYYVRVVEDPVCRWSQELCIQLKTCANHLQACSLDKTRTCTSNADCTAYSAGNCDQDYPAVCTTNADCDNLDVVQKACSDNAAACTTNADCTNPATCDTTVLVDTGTCGSTPAVDCAHPDTVPPGASECCNNLDRHPPKIQERAVASPIWYHPGRVGLSKGSVAFGKTASTDSLGLSLMIPASPKELDPAANAMTFTLRSGATVLWSASIPAATMTTKKPLLQYQFKDKTGAVIAGSGITGLTVKIGPNGAAIVIKTGKTLDLSAIAKAAQTLSLDMTSGTFSSTTDREFNYKSPKLTLAF